MRRVLISAAAVCAASLAYGGDDGHPSGTDGGNRAMPALRVFDANGKMVGPLTNLDGQAGVMLDESGVAVLAVVERKPDSTGRASASEFEWASAKVAQWSTASCSGTPLIPFSSQGTAGRPSVVVRHGDDVILYYAGDAFSGTAVNLSASSAQYGCEALTPAPRSGYCESESDCVRPASQSYYLPRQSLSWMAQGSDELTRRYPEPLKIGH
ncbi:hypothetical protein [Paraburkholderia sp. 40]|uniref:hypothetical protein n=1 Tax=Paraburkholderia sp. 40 TaxID=2991059 RepID=UPI003D1C9800